MSDDRSEEPIMDDVDWSRLSLARLERIRSRVSQEIHRRKRGGERPVPAADAPSRRRYAASLARVCPHRLRGSLHEYQRCVFIVSLGNKKFVESERLEASIQWIARHFTECVILVGDSVYRLTLEIRHGSSGDQARRDALRAGQAFIDEHGPLFERYADRCRFEFRSSSEVEKQPCYEIHYQAFQDIYRTDEPFHGLVDSFARTYLDRGHGAKPGQTDEARPNHHLAMTYLLEESAIFTCLADEGWSALVYPGSIRTFEEISEGLHPSVPESLQGMVWVSLRLKKKPARS